MKAEYDALIRNQTWDLVPSDPSRIVVDCKWLFRVKHKPDGSIDRYKAHLVAKGFTQRPGLDYHSTFNPAVKPAIVRLVLAIATQRSWPIHQLDVNNAFLQEVTVYILIYVDDIIITGNIGRSIRSIIDTLSQRFSLKDLGLVHYFLGVEVISTPAAIYLSQHKYVIDLLDELHMVECKGVPTPMTSTCSFADSEADSVVDISLYRRIIGKLHYLSFTMPDIGFAVSKLSQFMHYPKVSHWKAIKRLLRYLKHTSTMGVKLCRQPTDRLLTYSDSDWAGNPQDRTSTTGYVVYLGNSPISWSSKKQRSVSRSSTEAEYRAVAAVVSEVNWLTNLLHELHFPLSAPPTVLCDNVSTTYICANPVFHSRMKHVDIDFHFVRGQV
uniref:Uncharacterized mitochondrial protein AtMg00810-like n=1 Tax=Nicotiana tabacum TaxID=4097 RepID=A0A1S4DLR5_TOBAC|nr:PREDICTED: uncharacterized mitochondrial protein AtMg00810-like [Nicotiana tabacum]